MLAHPAHWIALGFGSGLSPRAPGTVGTLWAWVAFLRARSRWLDAGGWARADRRRRSRSAGGPAPSPRAHLGVADPGAIVWDEIVAFWLVLWLVMPAGLRGAGVAFALFRFFDAAKPGPVGWADRRFKLRARRRDRLGAGFGILFDDLVAALCTLLVIALWQRVVADERSADRPAPRARALAEALRARGWRMATRRELHRRPDRRRLHRRSPARATGSSAASSPTATKPRPRCSACRRR